MHLPWHPQGRICNRIRRWARCLAGSLSQWGHQGFSGCTGECSKTQISGCAMSSAAHLSGRARRNSISCGAMLHGFSSSSYCVWSSLNLDGITYSLVQVMNLSVNLIWLFQVSNALVLLMSHSSLRGSVSGGSTPWDWDINFRSQFIQSLGMSECKVFHLVPMHHETGIQYNFSWSLEIFISRTRLLSLHYTSYSSWSPQDFCIWMGTWIRGFWFRLVKGGENVGK